MTALKLSVDNSGALSAIQEVQAMINDIPDVSYKKIVYQIYGEGSEVKPIGEKILDINTAFGAIGDLTPSVTANFSRVTQQIHSVSNDIVALSDIHPIITADFSSVFANIAKAQTAVAQLGSSGISLSFPDLHFPDLQISDVSLSGVSIPQFATGTPYVEKDMIAQLHKGEAVVPGKFNIFKDTSFQDVVGNRGTKNYQISMGNIQIVARETDNIEDLARKIVKPVRDELRKLENIS